MDQKIALLSDKSVLETLSTVLDNLAKQPSPPIAVMHQLYCYALDWAQRAILSAQEHEQLITLLSDVLSPALLHGKHYETLKLLCHRLNTLFKVRKEQKINVQNAQILLMRFQESLIKHLGKKSHALLMLTSTVAFLAEGKEEFDRIVSLVESTLQGQYELNKQNDYSRMLKKAICIQLLGYMSSTLAVRETQMVEALRLSIEMQSTEKMYDQQTVQSFASWIDFSFAHAFASYIEEIDFKTTDETVRRKIFEQALAAGEGLLQHAQYLANDPDLEATQTFDLDDYLLPILAKAQKIYERIVTCCSLNEQAYYERALVRLAQIIKCQYALPQQDAIKALMLQVIPLIPWCEHRERLAKHREKLKSALESSPETESLTHIDAFNQRLRKFIRKLWHYAENWLGAPLPFEYVLLGFGSFARSEACPYSDLEFGLLVEEKGLLETNQSLTWSILQIFNMQFIALGEGGCSRHISCIGLRWDDTYHPLKVSRLWNSPEEVSSYVQHKNLSDLEGVNILLNATPLVNSVHGVALYTRFQTAIRERLYLTASDNHSLSVACQLAEELRKKMQKDAAPFPETSNEISIKEMLLRPIVFLLQVLALENKIEATSSQERIEALQREGKITPLLAKFIKRYLTFILRIRCLAHLQYESEGVRDEKGDERLWLGEIAQLPKQNTPFVLKPPEREWLKHLRSIWLPILHAAFSKLEIYNIPVIQSGVFTLPTIYRKPFDFEEILKTQILSLWLSDPDSWKKIWEACSPKCEVAPLSILSSDQTALKYSQQVEKVAKLVQDKVAPAELSAFFKLVTEGHLVYVEERLRRIPILVLGIGTVTDLSKRTFNNITALQYAAWALDREMCALLMKYAGQYYSAIQLKALWEAPERYSSYGANYDITPFITKMKTYIDEGWYSGNSREDRAHDKHVRYWQEEVGGEQKKCPAWLIYAWSEVGYEVAWKKKDFSLKIKREYDKHRLEWWFTHEYNNGKGVGSSWAALRGGTLRPGDNYLTPTWDASPRTYYFYILPHDYKVLCLVDQYNAETLEMLKTATVTIILPKTSTIIASTSFSITTTQTNSSETSTASIATTTTTTTMNLSTTTMPATKVTIPPFSSLFHNVAKTTAPHIEAVQKTKVILAGIDNESVKEAKRAFFRIAVDDKASIPTLARWIVASSADVSIESNEHKYSFRLENTVGDRTSSRQNNVLCNNAAVILLFVDLSSGSFGEARNFLPEYLGIHHKAIPVILVGIGSIFDKRKRIVTYQQASNISEEMGAMCYCEFPLMDYNNVQQIFKYITQKLCKNHLETKIEAIHL